MKTLNAPSTEAISESGPDSAGPAGEFSQKKLANLAATLSQYLAFERKAGASGLFEALPRFKDELALYHLMWWQSVQALRLAPDLLYLAEENQKEVQELIKEAREGGDAVDLLAYARELRDETEAANKLLRRLENARS